MRLPGAALPIAGGLLFSLLVLVYVVGPISGCHLNPAVTLALAVCSDFPTRKILPYWIAQMAGAFVASALVSIPYLRWRRRAHSAASALHDLPL